MTTLSPPLPPSQSGVASPSPHSLFNFANAAETRDGADPLTTLRHRVTSLPPGDATPEQREALRDILYAQSMDAVAALHASLIDAALVIPIDKTKRRQVRNAQQLLRILCEDYIKHIDDAPPSAGRYRETYGKTLWRSVHALAQHLLIGSLIAAPPSVGVWRQMHQLFATARRLGVSDYAAETPQATIQNVYFSAVLLSCIQPASFTPSEIAFISTYLARYADDVEFFDPAEPGGNGIAVGPATFWIDPTRDATAFACARKAPPPQTSVDYFSCSRLAARLARQLGELERGTPASLLDLPALADTPAGQGILRRLRAQWGEPSKRRFPRRRQNYRAQLCAGLRRLWRLLQDDGASPGDASNWMITNESPDGYALMHVAGRISGLAVGDLTAIRTETGTSWQICIVRWALSENQEHLELGLQILATRAQPARLALPSEDSNPALLPALILPAIGTLRPAEQLVIPSAALGKLPEKLVLVVEKGNVELREVKCLRLAENNSKIAILTIEADPQPR